jgi:hypothetical protein
MDAPETYKLNGDDTHAVSAVALALLFLLNKTPSSTETIISKFYSSSKEDSKKTAAADKTFMRDRDKFASFGLFTESVKGLAKPSWRLDRMSTLVDPTRFGKASLTDVAYALSPLLKDPNFVLAPDLATALVKLHLDFESVLDGVRNDSSPIERKLREARASRMGVNAKYLRADGTLKACTLLPYGFFALWNRRYVVCADAEKSDEPPHTYLIRRFSSATFARSVRFDIPADFDISQHEKLPIQMGPEVARASFFAPAGCDPALKPQLRIQGDVSEFQNGSYLVSNIGIASIPLAASWAYANGLVPTAPETLVADYHASFGPVS